GVPVTVVIMPEKDQVYGSLSDLPNRMFSAMLADLEMPAIDLLPKMRSIAAVRPPLWHDVVQGHLSPEGHRFVAGILSEWLKGRADSSHARVTQEYQRRAGTSRVSLLKRDPVRSAVSHD